MTTSAELMSEPGRALQRIREHLVRSGWRMDDEDERTSLWRWAHAEQAERGAEIVVVLPGPAVSVLDRGLVNDAVRAIAYVEDRTVNELMTDLAIRGGAGTVSVRLTPEAPSGSAPLTTGQTTMTALHDWVVGAASGVVMRDLVLPARRPQRAESYASRALVSTEPGSFIVNLALPRLENGSSRVPDPVPDRPQEPTLLDVEPQPYGRKVLARMRQVLGGSVSLADAVGAGDRPIQDFAIPSEVAANATELAALSVLGGGQPGRYQVRFTQAPDRESWERPRHVTVTPAQQAVLAQAASFLRERQPRTGVTVVGLVVRLSRVGHVGSGDITVQGESDDSGAQRRFRMELAEAAYGDAVRAHTHGLQVVATGDIEVAGTTSSLRRLTSFGVLPGLGD